MTNHLTGMHPRVGPAGTRDGYGMTKHRAESLLQLALYGASLRLRLPAEEVGAVVCYVEEVLHTLLLLLRKKVPQRSVKRSTVGLAFRLPAHP